MTNRIYTTGQLVQQKPHEPDITHFSNLKHFFKFEEPALGAATRNDAICAVSGLSMDKIIACEGEPTLIQSRVNENDYGAIDAVDYFYRLDNTPNRQIDFGAGSGTCGFASTRVCSEPWANLGSDDFLVLNAGHNLVYNVSGGYITLGSLDSGSIITNSSGPHGGGEPESYIAVQDTNGNSVTLEPALDSAGNSFGRAAGGVGQLEPIFFATYRRGATIYRRAKNMRTGEEMTTSASCAHFTGAVSPPAEWFWADHIPYGMCVIGFPSGLPSDVDAACDYMAESWRRRFYNKTVYYKWAD